MFLSVLNKFELLQAQIEIYGCVPPYGAISTELKNLILHQQNR